MPFGCVHGRVVASSCSLASGISSRPTNCCATWRLDSQMVLLWLRYAQLYATETLFELVLASRHKACAVVELGKLALTAACTLGQ
jgi:hypothetical protein